MKKTPKGKPGYVQYERIKRLAVMVLMFAIPIGIYATAYRILGTNRNIMTIVSIVGIIPAARFAVSWIMIMLQKKADPEAVRVTEEIAGKLVHGCELMVTAYDGRLNLDAIVVCGNEVAAVCLHDDKSKIPMMESHIAKILNSNNYFNSNVKIFDNLKHYTQRIEKLAQNPDLYREGIKFTPDERYPELNRDELVMHTIMAICV